MNLPSVRGFRLLPWDSDLFGFPVAVVPADVIRAGRLPELMETLQAEGVRLAYASVPWSDTAPKAALASLGAQLVDRRVRYRKDAIRCDAMPPGVESILGAPCSPDLEQLALASGALSRFRADPDIPPRVFEKLYLAWIRRSLSGDIARDVLVIREGEGCAGMATLAGSDRGETGTIGLIAVAEHLRGRGYGTRLMAAAEAWCTARGVTTLEVVTQMRNVAACRLYTACGYEIVGEDAVFHIWPGRT